MNDKLSSISKYRKNRFLAENQILSSKLYIPPLTTNYVKRLRLIQMLDQSTHQKLTLVSASAGFGKTTLVSDWTHHSTRDVAWVSLERGDNAFVRFWTYVTVAIGQSHPGFAEEALPIFHSFGSLSIESSLSFFLNELNRIPRPITLVLDDYHLIESSDIHESVAYLLNYMPTFVHLILISRTAPQLPLSRLRARSQITELGNQDLRFSLEETQELQLKTANIKLSHDEAVLLEERTEGWAVGLIMAFHSLIGRDDQAHYIQAFSGNHRHVLDYLIDEVMLRQPQEVQTFLLETSILEQLSTSLCEAVTTSEESAQLLAYVERANLFIIPQDDTRTWYRYHHLFAEMLRNRSRQLLGMKHQDELHRRAYVWFGEQGFYMEAIRHAMEAKQFDAAGQYMETYLPNIIQNGEQTNLLQWLEDMPLQSVIRHPNLFFFQEGNKVARGRTAEAQQYLDRAEQLLKSQPELFSADIVQTVQEKIRLYRNSIAYYTGDIDSFMMQSANNLHLLEKHGSIANVVNLGDALLYRGPIGFGGRLRKIAYLSAKVSADEKLSRILHASLGGNGFILLADLLYEWNRIPEAQQAVEKVLYSGHFANNPSVLVPAYILLSKIKQAEGLEEQAKEIVLRAIGEMQTSQSPRWQLLLEAQQARMQLAQGDIHSAAEWAGQRHVRITDQPSVAREFEHLTLARILMAQRKRKQAVSWLIRLGNEAERTDRLASRIEILLLLSICYQGQADWTRAMRTLEQACRLAEPEDFIRLFLDEGQPLAELLSRWLTDHSIEDDGLVTYAKKLLTLMEASGSSGLSDRGSGGNPSTDMLTSREKEILQKIAEGLSNEEIAGQLYISSGTVKKYIHQLYGKLQAKNRVQAVSRAKEWNLL
ncbi:LuxR C-terminal-related transcriptional regulator [Cohnella sp. WQ 127256]|uniref:LuxR C-terminal-related transcriptional regulator n=1 Tax=Cohnella sp. WQ 127256 TaxID=2938790 RepID=UPI00211988C7|nr:LuxR C-terminal-related transcriptional regulator [Cohnella sp. WQ 127256]